MRDMGRTVAVGVVKSVVKRDVGWKVEKVGKAV